MIAHAKAAKVAKGGLVIWDGLLVCGPIGYVGLGVVLLLMVGSQEEEIMIKKKGLPPRMS